MHVIIRKKRRTVSIKLTSAGGIEIHVPERMADGDVAVILKKHQPWIEKKQAEIRQARQNYPQLASDDLFYQGEIWKLRIDRGFGRYARIDPLHKTITSGIQLNALPHRTVWYKKEAKSMLPAELAVLAKRYGFTYTKTTVRAARKRWGSCTTGKKISLNSKLILAPKFVREAIMLHELTHTLHMHHKETFWQDLLKTAPRWHEAAKWLKDHSGWMEMIWDK